MLKATAWADGGVRGTPGPYACAGVVSVDGELRPREKAVYLGANGTNNQAEYEGLLLVLEMAQQAGVTHLAVRMDSELVIKQVLGAYRVKNAQLKELHALAIRLAQGFAEVKISHVPRHKNVLSDRLCTEILDQITGQARR